MNPAPMILDDAHCELCGEPIPQEDVSVEAFEASGLLICTECLEATLDASTFNARTTMGLVGAGR